MERICIGDAVKAEALITKLEKLGYLEIVRKEEYRIEIYLYTEHKTGLAEWLRKHMRVNILEIYPGYISMNYYAEFDESMLDLPFDKFMQILELIKKYQAT